MKIREPKSMAEIHKIREKHYRETRDMSVEEKRRYIREKVESFEQRYNLKLRRYVKKSYSAEAKI